MKKFKFGKSRSTFVCADVPFLFFVVLLQMSLLECSFGSFSPQTLERGDWLTAEAVASWIQENLHFDDLDIYLGFREPNTCHPIFPTFVPSCLCPPSPRLLWATVQYLRNQGSILVVHIGSHPLWFGPLKVCLNRLTP